MKKDKARYFVLLTVQLVGAFFGLFRLGLERKLAGRCLFGLEKLRG